MTLTPNGMRTGSGTHQDGLLQKTDMLILLCRVGLHRRHGTQLRIVNSGQSMILVETQDPQRVRHKPCHRHIGARPISLKVL